MLYEQTCVVDICVGSDLRQMYFCGIHSLHISDRLAVTSARSTLYVFTEQKLTWAASFNLIEGYQLNLLQGDQVLFRLATSCIRVLSV